MNKSENQNLPFPVEVEAPADECSRKPYTRPSLKEYGNVAELTKGQGGLLLDLALQGSIAITVL